MVLNHFIELKAARWDVEIDGEALGRVVMNHDLVVDEVLGVAFESWAWVQYGQAHVIHLSGDREGGFEVVIDGTDVKDPRLELETYISEKEQTHLKLHLRFEDRYLIFNALLE